MVWTDSYFLVIRNIFYHCSRLKILFQPGNCINKLTGLFHQIVKSRNQTFCKQELVILHAGGRMAFLGNKIPIRVGRNYDFFSRMLKIQLTGSHLHRGRRGDGGPKSN